MNMVARALLAALLALSASCLAQAQSWPDRPIKFISSQAAGGGTDVIGRLVADQLASRLGQPIVYENRPGGGNVIGTQAAARSAPDGYTFFFASAAALVTDPYTYKSLPYDPMKDFDGDLQHREVTFDGVGASERAGEDAGRAFALRQDRARTSSHIATDGARFSGMIAAWINKLAGTSIVRARRADDPGRPGYPRRPGPARILGGPDGARTHRRAARCVRWR